MGKKNSDIESCIERCLERRWKSIYIEEKETEYLISDDGLVYSKKSNKMLKPHINTSGYPQVALSANNKRYSIGVHRLVAKAFVSNPNIIYNIQVNHIDGNKQNNHYTNLEWCTLQENITHACVTGLRDSFKGVNSPKNKYPEIVIRSICQLLEDGYSQKHISDFLGVNKGVVNSIKRKKMWKHISCNYNIPIPITRVPREPGLREKVIEILTNQTTDVRTILKILGMEDNRKNRTYVAVIRHETKEARSSSTIPEGSRTEANADPKC